MCDITKYVGQNARVWRGKKDAEPLLMHEAEAEAYFRQNRDLITAPRALTVVSLWSLQQPARPSDTGAAGDDRSTEARF